ncbi:hypothetical protein BgiBS90_013551, partial [Biomphalaria glabrata]
QGRIVNTGSFGPGDSFIVQCDRNKFQRPGLPKSPRINELIVERKIEGADAYTTMARFRPFLDKIVDRRVTVKSFRIVDRRVTVKSFRFFCKQREVPARKRI